MSVEEHPDGFIGEFKDIILQRINTVPRWAEAVSTGILSTAVGPSKMTYTRVGPLHLNLFHLIVGASGIAHKTTPLKYHAIPMLEEFQYLLNDGDDNPKTAKDLFLPSRFSIEGMISYFSGNKHQAAQDEGVIIRDEFTSAIKDMNKDYLSDFIEFVSECYDGSAQKRYTRGTQLEKTKKVYVNLLAATTPFLYSVMTYSLFLQGFVNRILFILDSPHDTVEQENPDRYFANAREDQREIEEQREVFARNLLTLRRSAARIVQPDDSDGLKLVKFKYRMETELNNRYKKDNLDIYCSYLARMPEMAFKLTALHALSRWYTRLGNWTLDTITTRDDADWAIAKVEYHYDAFKKMLEAWRARPEVFIPKTMDAQMSQVLDFLRSREKGASWSEIRGSIRWDNTVWNRVLNILVDTKQVFMIVRKQIGPGRPTCLLSVLENKDKAVALGDTTVDNWETVKANLHL